LIQNRYNKKYPYSDNAIKTFQKLFELSGLPLNERTEKYKLLLPKKETNFNVISNDPNSLIKRLETLIGSFNAGNKDNKDLYNQIIGLMDYLLTSGIIDKDQHKKIFLNYLNF